MADCLILHGVQIESVFDIRQFIFMEVFYSFIFLYLTFFILFILRRDATLKGYMLACEEIEPLFFPPFQNTDGVDT